MAKSWEGPIPDHRWRGIRLAVQVQNGKKLEGANPARFGPVATAKRLQELPTKIPQKFIQISHKAREEKTFIFIPWSCSLCAFYIEFSLPRSLCLDVLC